MQSIVIVSGRIVVKFNPDSERRHIYPPSACFRDGRMDAGIVGESCAK